MLLQKWSQILPGLSDILTTEEQQAVECISSQTKHLAFRTFGFETKADLYRVFETAQSKALQYFSERGLTSISDLYLEK